MAEAVVALMFGGGEKSLNPGYTLLRLGCLEIL